jgi:hypothetical protein
LPHFVTRGRSAEASRRYFNGFPCPLAQA